MSRTYFFDLSSHRHPEKYQVNSLAFATMNLGFGNGVTFLLGSTYWTRLTGYVELKHAMHENEFKQQLQHCFGACSERFAVFPCGSGCEHGGSPTFWLQRVLSDRSVKSEYFMHGSLSAAGASAFRHDAVSRKMLRCYTGQRAAIVRSLFRVLPRAA
jgi:hypothetical protein